MRCVVLLSGGLDSMLAVRILQEQGVEVEALNFKTIFTCCQDTAAKAARELGVRLTIISQEDDYLDLVRKPMFGYGKGANPCIDCRIYMFRRARRFMEQVGASFVASGEVLGQRPKSQKRRDLEIISHHSDLEDLLLRPLSAKNLPPTLPEREGWVDRERLYDFTGQSRKGLIDLAGQLGITDIPSPSNGCALTEIQFSHKVFDLMRNYPAAQRSDYELLSVGRHFRFDSNTKVVVGRNESDNALLERFFEDGQDRAVVMLTPHGFQGPTAVLQGVATDDSLAFAAGLIARYARQVPDEAQVIARSKSGTQFIAVQREIASDALPITAG